MVQGCAVYGPKDGIFSIIAASSMHMILTAPTQARQLPMSMPAISRTSGL